MDGSFHAKKKLITAPVGSAGERQVSRANNQGRYLELEEDFSWRPITPHYLSEVANSLRTHHGSVSRKVPKIYTNATIFRGRTWAILRQGL